MKTFDVKALSRNVCLKYDLNTFALPLFINIYYNFPYDCWAMEIDLLCFGLRILVRKENKKNEQFGE